jgi:hypothetical protein
MATRLVQNTCIHKKRKTIHNYLKNVPSKKKGHPITNSNNILLDVAKVNSILELQSFLEHNNFTRKSAIIIEPMLIYLSNKHN